MLIGLGALGGIAAGYFAAKRYWLALKQIAPKIRRLSRDADAIVLELEGGDQCARIDWLLLRSGALLRPIRVKHATVRNWEGVELFRDFGGWRVPLQSFAIGGKHGLPEGLIRIQLHGRPQHPIRVILIGRAGRYGELGRFALQGKVAQPAGRPELAEPPEAPGLASHAG